MSEITTSRASFDDYVGSYPSAGITGIGVWESKLEGRPYDLAAQAITRAGLIVTNLVPSGNSVFPTALSPLPTDPGPRVDRLVAALGQLAVLRPENVVVVTGVGPGPESAEDRRRCVAELRRIVQHARELGLSVALKPMHTSAAADFSFVNTLADAAALVADVDEPGWAFCMTPGTWGRTRAPSTTWRPMSTWCAASRWPRPPARAQLGRSRFPRRGDLPLTAMVTALEAGGYRGSYDVDLFRRRPVRPAFCELLMGTAGGRMPAAVDVPLGPFALITTRSKRRQQ